MCQIASASRRAISDTRDLLAALFAAALSTAPAWGRERCVVEGAFA
jgi:hypothetical protein